ncbi:MAG: hypothetical protein L0Z70_03980, partial [Chloroflexi bacterium]|nr:hypothetical protein [Chloroflexota bacterium]
LERVGRRSYGLYLTHLIVMDLFFFAIQWLLALAPGWSLLLVAILFGVGLTFPVWMMEALAKGPARRVYRYLFG